MFNKEVLSFDIGTYSTKVVLGKGMKNKVMIKDAFSFPTPVGAVEDGQIINAIPLQEEILKILDQKKIYTNKAIFTLASSKAITRELTLPYVNEKKMAAMVPYELPKHIPIAVDNYIIKHLTLDIFKEENLKKAHILVIALPKYIVKKYWDLSWELEIEPTVLTLHGVGAVGFFPPKSPFTGEPETIALIDLGHASINCNIISEGKLVFNRFVSTAGLKVSPDKFANYDKDISPTNYNRNVKATIDKWLEEIKLVFRFYFSLQNKSKIDRIVLSGGAAKFDNLAAYMEEKLEIPTSVLEDKDRIIYKGKEETFPVNQYFNALSALLLN